MAVAWPTNLTARLIPGRTEWRARETAASTDMPTRSDRGEGRSVLRGNRAAPCASGRQTARLVEGDAHCAPPENAFARTAPLLDQELSSSPRAGTPSGRTRERSKLPPARTLPTYLSTRTGHHSAGERACWLSQKWGSYGPIIGVARPGPPGLSAIGWSRMLRPAQRGAGTSLPWVKKWPGVWASAVDQRRMGSGRTDSGESNSSGHWARPRGSRWGSYRGAGLRTDREHWDIGTAGGAGAAAVPAGRSRPTVGAASVTAAAAEPPRRRAGPGLGRPRLDPRSTRRPGQRRGRARLADRRGRSPARASLRGRH